MSDPAAMLLAMDLTDTERQILAFEGDWFRYAGAKEQAVRDTFGMTATVYYATLNALIDRPEALAAAPLVVRRLQRIRSQRQRRRAG